MLAEGAKAGVKIPAQFEDLLAAGGKRLLRPCVGDSPQHRDEGGGRRDDDFLPGGVLQEGRVLLQRGSEERLGGYEQHDELRAGGKLPPVRLRPERVHMGAQMPRVGAEPFVASGLVRCLGGLEERDQGHLRIHNDVPVARQVNDHVRSPHALITGDGGLFGEVAAGDHPGDLGHPTELHLPPRPSGLGFTQGRDQSGGLRS